MIKKMILVAIALFSTPLWALTHQPMQTDLDKKSITVFLQKPEFTITLPSNPTTGFFWHLKKYSKNMFEFISQKYVVPKTKLIGAPGVQEFKFKAKQGNYFVAQVSHIVFVYKRPWEKKSVKKKTFIMVVKNMKKQHRVKK